MKTTERIRGARVPAISLLALMFAASLAACGSPAKAPAPPQATSRAQAQAPDQAPEIASGVQSKGLGFGRRDMVAAANPIAVDAGVAILARGGSAVDAAIAVQMVLNLVEPQASGIGGGAFLMHWDRSTRALLAYDGRETAPAAASAEQFVDASGRPLPFMAAVDSGLSVGTPGLLRMLELAHKAHGRIAWAELFAPAIALAERGFEISPRLATQVAAAAQRIRAQGEPVSGYFLNSDGSPKPVGTRLRNPEFAATLRAIAAGGADAFYRGEIAQAIVDRVRTHPTRPGRLALDDLRGYTAKVRPALCGPYRGFTICGMPPPSSGALTTLQTLGILSEYDLRRFAPDSADAVHLISEAYRLAYADRARYIADPDFVRVPVEGMLDPGYLKARAALIRSDRSLGAAPAGEPAGARAGAAGVELALPSTSHVSIVDREGNAVSMTTTIEFGFGSLQMVRGFLLNNQLTDFSFAPADAAGAPIANRVEPGKRPRSSMAPTIVFGAGGDVEIVLGSPGGSNIIQYVTKALIGLIDWRLDAQRAIDLPNFGAQTTATTQLEKDTAIARLADALRARGHTIAIVDLTSGLQAIVFNGRRAGIDGALSVDPAKGEWSGGADPRREGVARGTR